MINKLTNAITLCCMMPRNGGISGTKSSCQSRTLGVSIIFLYLAVSNSWEALLRIPSTQVFFVETSSSNAFSLPQPRPPQDHQVLHLPHGPTFIYVLGGSGLCSQLLNGLTLKVYYEDTKKKSFVADESLYKYRLNDEQGILTGYFTPTFPIIDHAEQYELVAKHWNAPPYPPPEKLCLNCNDPSSAVTIRDMMRDFPSFAQDRYQLRQTYSPQILYSRIVNEACRDLQFNAATQTQIDNYKHQMGMPHDLTSTKDVLSVGFHVRRGNKLTKEARFYTAKEYVEKMWSVVTTANKNNNNNNDNDTTYTKMPSIQYCFVASDDYKAVEEMTTALKAHPDVSCTVQTLTTPNDTGFDESYPNSPIQFLSQLSILRDTSFFIGTFNSNVGSLVSVLRACSQGPKDREHYSRSYGVDEDEWFVYPKTVSPG